MLTAVDGGAAVVVCNTCRSSATSRANGHGKSGGERLVAALRAMKESDSRYDGIAVQEMPCLFACQFSCTVHIRAPGKVSYVLGGFVPDPAAACAILDYAAHYAESDYGQVAYSKWPDGVKGHFITRSPPDGFVAR